MRWSHEELKYLVSRVTQMRKDATQWGNQKVETMIVSKMRDCGHSLNTWRDLKDAWKSTGELKFAARLWVACFGQFEGVEGGGWERRLEKECMAQNGIRYKTNSAAGSAGVKGCFSKVFSRCKTDRMKALAGATKATHGGQIRKHRNASGINPQNMWKKRPKGDTLGPWLVMDGVEYHELGRYLAEGDENTKRHDCRTQVRSCGGDLSHPGSGCTVGSNDVQGEVSVSGYNSPDSGGWTSPSGFDELPSQEQCGPPNEQVSTSLLIA